MVNKNKRKTEMKKAKAFKGLPRSSWITLWDDTTSSERKRSTQKVLPGSKISIDGMIGDSHMLKLNPKIAKYRRMRKEGKTIWEI